MKGQEWVSHALLRRAADRLRRAPWPRPNRGQSASVACGPTDSPDEARVDSAGIARVSLEFFTGALAFGAYWRSKSLATLCQRLATPLVLTVLAIAAFSRSDLAGSGCRLCGRAGGERPATSRFGWPADRAVASKGCQSHSLYLHSHGLPSIESLRT